MGKNFDTSLSLDKTGLEVDIARKIIAIEAK